MKQLKAGFWFGLGIVGLAISGFCLSQIFLPERSLLIFLCGWVGIGAGFVFLRRGMRESQPSAEQILAKDNRAPILFLRSFKDDDLKVALPEVANRNPIYLFVPKPRAEDSLIPLNDIGPLVAIGRPGEALPETGAFRLYVSDSEWKNKVSDLMKKASFVLMLGKTTTGGVHWEVENTIQKLKPDQLLFYFPSSLGTQDARELYYKTFRASIQKYFAHPLPEYIGHKNFLRFQDDWKPSWVRSESPSSKNDFQDDLSWIIQHYSSDSKKAGFKQRFKSLPLARKVALIILLIAIVAMWIAVLVWLVWAGKEVWSD